MSFRDALRGRRHWPTRWSASAVAAAVLALSAGPIAAGAAPAAATPSITSTIPLVPAVLYPGDETVSALSCPSAGNCVAIGVGMVTSGVDQLFAIDETNGVWGPGQVIADPLATLSLISLNSMACSSAGNCVAVGAAVPSGQNPVSQAITVQETAGVWGGVQYVSVPGTAPQYPELDAVSCPSDGDCTAVGDVASGAAIFVSETAGQWGEATIDGPYLAPSASDPLVVTHPAGIVCASAGNCTAVSNYPYAATETNGVWSAFEALPTPAGSTVADSPLLTSLSCPTQASCVAVGNVAVGPDFLSTPFVEQETSVGTWSVTTPSLPDPAAAATLSSLSCYAPGQCMAVGSSYVAPVYPNNAMWSDLALLDDNGNWTIASLPQPTIIPNRQDSFVTTPRLTSVSCAARGDCTAVGYVNIDARSTTLPFSLVQYQGKWLPSSFALDPPGVGPPADGAVLVSCAAPGECAMAGDDQGTPVVDSETLPPMPPAPRAPSAPSIVKVTSAVTSVVVRLGAPKSNGGAAVTSYQYTLNGGPRWMKVSTNLKSLTMRITRLKASTLYRIRVRALNVAGASPASAPRSVRTLRAK